MSGQHLKRARHSRESAETELPSKKKLKCYEDIDFTHWKEHSSGQLLSSSHDSRKQPSVNTESVYDTGTLNSLPMTPTTPKTPQKNKRNKSGSRDIPYSFTWWGSTSSPIDAPEAASNEYSHSGIHPFTSELPSSMKMSRLQVPQNPGYLAPFYQTFQTSQGLSELSYPTPTSDFDAFSPCGSPLSASFQVPTTLSGSPEAYFNSTISPTTFSPAVPMVTLHNHDPNRLAYCLPYGTIAPTEWPLGLDCFADPSSASLHSCLTQASAILGEMKQHREAIQNLAFSGQRSQGAGRGLLRDTIAMSRDNTDQITRILSCGCLSQNDRLARLIAAVIFEMITNYLRIARGISGDQSRVEGPVRARVGLILGELPNISHFIDLFASRWYQVQHASNLNMIARDMLSKQEEVSLSPLDFSQLEGKLRQCLQAATREIMRYCGRV